MKYEIDLPPEVQHCLAVRASETGQDVVYLIQLAVTRFVAEEVSAMAGVLNERRRKTTVDVS